jgi:HisA/HisF family protein
VQLIPVIDLKGGRVVHARRGERDTYAPIRSSLTAGAEPFDIASALLRLHPFQALYLADLDAIAQRGSNLRAIEALHNAFPWIELWVDAGIADPAGLREWQGRRLGRAVIGTECNPHPDLVAMLRTDSSGSCPLLSIDFDQSGPLGSESVLGDPSVWPQDVIVMALARVGSGAGPDLSALDTVRARAQRRRVFAAGGVRGSADLATLRSLGVAGALVASCLHEGQLTSADLASFAAGGASL